MSKKDFKKTDTTYLGDAFQAVTETISLWNCSELYKILMDLTRVTSCTLQKEKHTFNCVSFFTRNRMRDAEAVGIFFLLKLKRWIQQQTLFRLVMYSSLSPHLPITLMVLSHQYPMSMFYQQLTQHFNTHALNSSIFLSFALTHSSHFSLSLPPLSFSFYPQKLRLIDGRDYNTKQGHLIK